MNDTAPVIGFRNRGILGDYRSRLKDVKPHPGVARVATVRKANGILFAIQRDQRINDLRIKKEPPM